VAQFLFFNCLARPLILFVLGLNVRRRERLPGTGPAIVVGNHNSHLDTLVLMTLFPSAIRRHVRPVAAADYFLRNRLLAWFALRVIGVIPLDRAGGRPREEVLEPVARALDAGEIVIVFPEGSRGEPERLARLKSGVADLGASHPHVPVVPVFLHGLGKALPRGEALLVPFFCDVFVGEPLATVDARAEFMQRLTGAMNALAAEGRFPSWE
jgi:1-acyl-sn-glycerol-3-phosphate acyltransferase